MEREVVGDNVEVIASTFDQLPSNHTKVSEMVLDRAKKISRTWKGCYDPFRFYY